MSIKRVFSAAIIATTLMAAGTTAGFAQGGSDPIVGIDIIIKKDPGSQPIKPFSVGKSSMTRLNSLNGDDRAAYLMGLIAKRIDADKGVVRNGTAALRKKICSKCEIGRSINVKFQSGKTTYSVMLKLSGIGKGAAMKPALSKKAKKIGE
ncbi:hypothetical protein WNZ14_14670 [Hoeflea sp. AS60]|uniref:hypothetical protein n=1 Tax=Hoeflea sp. AS60 TaxID=3135780 RepID=UPI0031779863